MAFLAALLSAIGNRLGSILQVIFGWSVTALFGQLPRKKQIAVSGALVLSLAWPLLLVGSFLPRLAAWVLTFLPLEHWLGHAAVRGLWAALAAVVPLVVGGLVRWAAPVPQMSLWGAIFYGYPLAVAFFGAFVVTAVTVPLVKLGSLTHGWSDEHVYLLARPGCYEQSLRDLVEACERGGLRARISEVPRRMTLATHIIKAIGRRVAQPMIGADLRRIQADGIELYLYPSDLYMRGTTERISTVRAMLTTTGIERSAYLVSSNGGQAIQDELGRLSTLAKAHRERGDRLGHAADTRLAEIWKEMNSSKLPFDEWTILETMARRLERVLAQQTVGKEAFVIDRATQNPGDEEAIARPHPPSGALVERPAEDASTVALVDQAFSQAADLVRAELALAMSDLRQDVREAKRAAIGFAVAIAAVLTCLACAAFALVLALGAKPWVALAVAGGFLCVGAAAAYYGYRQLPTNTVARTRKRLRGDFQELKERIA